MNKRQSIPVIRAAGVLQPPTRTAQDLLAERRATVNELRREKDPTARAMLQFAIDDIDRQLHQRDAISEAFTATRAVVARLEAERDARDLVAVCPSWSVAQHARRAA